MKALDTASVVLASRIAGTGAWAGTHVHAHMHMRHTHAPPRVVLLWSAGEDDLGEDDEGAE